MVASVGLPALCNGIIGFDKLLGAEGGRDGAKPRRHKPKILRIGDALERQGEA